MTAEADPDDPGDASGSAPPRHGRWLTIGGWSVLGLLVVGLAWVVVTGLVARSQLEDVRKDMHALRAAVAAGNTDRVVHLVGDIREHTASAHALTSGPAWWVAANVPVAGTPLQTARTISTAADRLGSDVLPAIVQLVRTLPSTSTAALNAVDLRTIEQARTVLTAAAGSGDRAQQLVSAADPSWLSYVSNGRRDVLRELTRVNGELTGAARTVRILPTMLGAQRPQRYYIGFLNEAEARGGGGIPGAFAIVVADRGRVRFERFGSDDDLKKVRANVRLGPELTARYGNNDPTGELPNSNLSPDFSVAARIWAGMWQAKTGETVDGAIALDPTTLSYLLNVTGPVTLADGSKVSGDDVVGIAQKRQYSLYPGTSARDIAERKAYLVELAQSISQRLLGGGSPAGFVRALSRAAGERRLVVWSAQAGIERQLREANWAGELGNDAPAPYSGFVVNNAAGSKLDYYLERRMTYRRSRCTAGGTATATISLTNTAPPSGLPPYVTFRPDGPPPGYKVGDNRLLLTYYADRSARITRLLVDGKPVPLFTQPEGNTTTATTTIELKVGQTVTAQVTVREPRADGPVTILRQPGVVPLQVDTRQDRCA